MEAKIAATRTREQLLSVLAHSQVTIFTLDRDKNLTMLEGALIWNTRREDSSLDKEGSKWYIGKRVDEVFRRLNPHSQQDGNSSGQEFLKSIDALIDGKIEEDVQEHGIGKILTPPLG